MKRRFASPVCCDIRVELEGPPDYRVEKVIAIRAYGSSIMRHDLLVQSEYASRDLSPLAEGKRSIFVVVGMHRSGTSLCANALGLLGVDMADEIGDNRSNPLGHFERWEFMKLQDEILSLFDRSYFSPTHDYPLPPAWWADFRLRPIKARLKERLQELMCRSDLFGFKDPRTTRLMPMWNQIFTELRLFPKFIVCLRNPAHIAASLFARDDLEVEVGELRALDYMVDALRHTRGRSRCFIRYDDWMKEPMVNGSKLLNFVNYSTVELRELEVAIQTVVRPEANRSGRTETQARQPLIRNFYNLVDRFVESDGADQSVDSKIESFIQNYIAFRQLLGPFEAQFKKVANERASIEADRTAAREQLTEVREALATERAAAAGIQEALLAAQTKGQQGEIALDENVKRVVELTAALTAVVGQRDHFRSVQAATAQQLAEAQETLAAERAATARDKEALLATQAKPQHEAGA